MPGENNLEEIKKFKEEGAVFLKNKFDYVYISSINSEHYNHCKFALENNKNVICEKPICLNKRQLSKLKSLAIKKKKKFFEVIQYVHHPLFAKLKSVIGPEACPNNAHKPLGFRQSKDPGKTDFATLS